jgi:hypothetical protein
MRRLIISLCLMTIVCSWTMRQEEAESTQVISARAGTVTRLNGEVWYRHRNETEVRPLKLGERLADGDMVLTGDHGRLELSLNPESFLQIGALSQVRLYDSRLDRMHFDIEQGEVFVIARSMANDVTLVLDTPPALLTVVRSGRYRVRVKASDATEAAVATGELQFVNKQGETIQITKGRRVRFAASSGEQKNGTWTHAFTVRQK